MKQLIYILLLNLFCLSSLSSQCFQPDASIWKDTWASCTKSANPIAEYGNSHWLQYNFGSVRNLSKTWVWNTNDPNQLDQGFKQVKIDYSEDGENWTNWGEMNFPKAEGDAIYSGFAGPDLQNIKAQYVLVTAISNYGDASCAGLAEVKFNLMPQEGTSLPPIEEETDDDDDDDESEIDVCGLIEEIDLNEFVEVEAEFTEAFIYLEISEEIVALPLQFAYRAAGGEWEFVAIESEEIDLEDLMTGTVYEYRITIQCGEEENASPISSFQTMTCSTVAEISLEEVTETEAFFLWPNPNEFDFYLVEVGIVGEAEKMEFEIEEAGLFLEELAPDTEYELRIGTECGEAIQWSEITPFKTAETDSDLSTSINSRLNLSAQQVQLFPNPTPGKLTIRLKMEVKDVLNYAISDLTGRTLFRNVTKLHSGTNDLKLDVSNLPDGTYWLHGVTLNQRASISEQVIKISK